MNTWLLKSEPGTWSWADQMARGVEPWDGVRSNAGAMHMKNMKKGDLAFFYHSGKERRIVGIVRIVKEYYPDPSDETGRFGMVDVETVGPVPKPIALADVKADPRFASLALVREGRLSVQPVDAKSWKALCAMGGVKAGGVKS